MKKTNIVLQQELDVKKWTASEENGKDMCGQFDYCPFCKIEEEFPCAKAYNRMVKAQNACSKATTGAKSEVKRACKAKDCKVETVAPAEAATKATEDKTKSCSGRRKCKASE